MRPIKKIEPAYFTSLLHNVDKVNSSIVQTALIDAIGNYCSYCEIPLNGDKVTHHRQVAAWQPVIQYSEWEDLLLICKDCRNHIREDRLTATQEGNMLWPDKDETFGLHAESPIIYILKKVVYKVVDEAGNTVSNEQKDLVFAVANPKSPEAVRQNAKKTIDHFQLNMDTAFYNAKAHLFTIPLEHHLQHADNRIFKRTQAWFEALDSVNRIKELNEHKDIDGSELILQFLKDQISTHCYHSGNWSVWMTVFNNDVETKGLTKELFLSDPRYFPGTNTNYNLFAE